MRYCSLVTCLLVVLLSAAAFAAPQPSAAPPGPPAQVPPPVGAPAAVAPPASGVVSTTLTLPQGWSIVSFPLSSLTSARGFTHQLFRYAAGQYYAVDPVASPASIDTRNAYAAYADAPTTVTLQGLSNPFVVRTVPIQIGWNLVGCPSGRPLPWAGVTVSSGTLTRPLSSAADWLTISPPAQGVLQPGQGVWVYAQHPLRLHLHPNATGNGPRIDRVLPATAPQGGSLEIQGASFGSAGEVRLAGRAITGDWILDWSPARIQLRLPNDAQSGELFVNTAHVSSNAVPITISPLTQGPATLMGQVVSEAGKPLEGAQLLLDSGQTTYTGQDGTFLLQGVPPGQHLGYISRVGYHTAVANINVGAGASQSMLIQLSLPREGPPGGVPASGSAPPPGAPAPASTAGTLHVIVDAYEDGYHRWWPAHVVVQKYNSSDAPWEGYWNTDPGGLSVELDCPGAQVGTTYTIQVEWRSTNADPLSNQWFRKMDSKEQTMELDSPY